MDIIIMMKKNDPIASFTYDGKVLKKFDVYDIKKMPIGFLNPSLPITDNFKNVVTCLDNWLKTRHIPSTRFGYTQVRSKLNLYDMTSILINNHALSLNDDYWFVDGNASTKWQEINFYNNKYSRDLGDFLFDPKQNRSEINFITPDLTTNGDDAKRWHQVENLASMLIKTNPNNEQVACNEVFASKIANRLNFSYIEYGLIRQHMNIYSGQEQGFKQMIDVYEDKNCLCSVCENYCTEDLSYVTAQNYLHSLKPATIKNLYDELSKSPNLKKKIDDMIILDYLINNTDRHLNNFGLLVNNENKIIDLFPIFDCGNSMNYLDRFETDKRDYSKMFNKTFNQLLDLVMLPKSYDLTVLNNIDNLFYKIYDESNLTDEEKESILRLFKMRVNNLKQFIITK